MRFCPSCESDYGDHVKFCPKDGTALEFKGQAEDPLVGHLVLGRWEVLARLGAGGFGTVYKARDTRLDSIDALKVFDRRRLPPSEADEAMRRFVREAVLLKKLGPLSTHIVGVSDIHEDPASDLLYLSMEYVDGENLAQILIREGPLDLDRTLEIVRQLCDALDVAHGEGVIHRDLKLENVMVTRDRAGDEVVKVLDFGIAKALGQKSLTNLALGGPGTPGYAAPEQIENRAPDQRTDLFALGVILYGILTGCDPWVGGAITEPTSGGWMNLIRQTLEGDPKPMRELRPEIPRSLEAVVLKLLEKSPENRFQSAALVRTALLEIKRGREGVAPGVLRVVTPTAGIRIVVKRGFRTVATGTTPWEGRNLAPGSYRVKVKDRGFEPESREVAVTSGGEAEAALNVTPQRPRPSPVSLLSPFLKPGPLALSVVPIAAVLVLVLGRPAPEMSQAQFLEHVEQSEVLSVHARDERLVAVVRRGDEEEAVRVDAQGMDLQRLVRMLDSRGVALTRTGRASVRVRLAGPSGGAPPEDLRVELAGAGGVVCSPCPPDAELDVDAGWLTIDARSVEVTVDQASVRDGSQVYVDEVIAPASPRRFFVPDGGRMDVTLALAHTELGAELARARRALEDRRLEEPPGENVLAHVSAALEMDPNNQAALTLRKRVAEAHLDAALTAERAGNDQAAIAAAEDCLRLDPGAEGCLALRGRASDRTDGAQREAELERLLAAAEGALAQARWRDFVRHVQALGAAGADGARVRDLRARGAAALRERSRQALTGDNADLALQLTGHCLEVSGGDAECTQVARRARAALEAAEAPPQQIEDPGETQTAGTTQPSTPPPAPASAPASALAGTITVDRYGFDRSDGRVTVVPRFTAMGAADGRWCVAALFTHAEGRVPESLDPDYTLRGRVAAFQEFRLAGNRQEHSAQLAVPADRLLVQPTGEHRYTVAVEVWDRPCQEIPPPPARALGEWSGEVCMYRRPLEWTACR